MLRAVDLAAALLDGLFEHPVLGLLLPEPKDLPVTLHSMIAPGHAGRAEIPPPSPGRAVKTEDDFASRRSSRAHDSAVWHSGRASGTPDPANTPPADYRYSRIDIAHRPTAAAWTPAASGLFRTRVTTQPRNRFSSMKIKARA